MPNEAPPPAGPQRPRKPRCFRCKDVDVAEPGELCAGCRKRSAPTWRKRRQRHGTTVKGLELEPRETEKLLAHFQFLASSFAAARGAEDQATRDGRKLTDAEVRALYQDLRIAAGKVVYVLREPLRKVENDS